MAILSSALSSLIDVGNDAQGNLYEVILTDGSFGKEGDDRFTIRCKGFDAPTPTQDSYSVKFVTATIDRPVTKISLDRSFTLEFRVDDNWKVYETLLDQQRKTIDASKSFVNIDLEEIKDSTFTTTVNIIDKLSSDENESGTLRKLFTFRNCWISSVSSPSFSTASADPVSVTCTINFLYMDDWQSGIAPGSNERENTHETNMREETASYTVYK